ncbi:MAG TPA: hypothetical protein VMV21_15605, partial [Vicinamibacteria bacterium]|nr:hypothetical protein [Vicinamibacteria bacterium]
SNPPFSARLSKAEKGGLVEPIESTKAHHSLVRCPLPKLVSSLFFFFFSSLFVVRLVLPGLSKLS